MKGRDITFKLSVEDVYTTTLNVKSMALYRVLRDDFSLDHFDYEEIFVFQELTYAFIASVSDKCADEETIQDARAIIIVLKRYLLKSDFPKLIKYLDQYVPEKYKDAVFNNKIV